MYANKFCDAGQVPIFRYFEACKRYLLLDEAFFIDVSIFLLQL